MKFFVASILACTLFAGEWDVVRRTAPDREVEVTAIDGTRSRGTFVRASDDGITVRSAAGERLIARADVRQVRVQDQSRRLRRGFMWTGIGVGAGAGIGVAVCPHCANEGAAYKYVGPGIGAGAAIGALGFLSSPYKTVYRNR